MLHLLIQNNCFFSFPGPGFGLHWPNPIPPTARYVGWHGRGSTSRLRRLWLRGYRPPGALHPFHFHCTSAAPLELQRERTGTGTGTGTQPKLALCKSTAATRSNGHGNLNRQPEIQLQHIRGMDTCRLHGTTGRAGCLIKCPVSVPTQACMDCNTARLSKGGRPSPSAGFVSDASFPFPTITHIAKWSAHSLKNNRPPWSSAVHQQRLSICPASTLIVNGNAMSHAAAPECRRQVANRRYTKCSVCASLLDRANPGHRRQRNWIPSR